MRYEDQRGTELIEQAVRRFLSDKIRVLDIVSTPLHSGYQAIFGYGYCEVICFDVGVAFSVQWQKRLFNIRKK